MKDADVAVMDGSGKKSNRKGSEAASVGRVIAKMVGDGLLSAFGSTGNASKAASMSGCTATPRFHPGTILAITIFADGDRCPGPGDRVRFLMPIDEKRAAHQALLADQWFCLHFSIDRIGYVLPVSVAEIEDEGEAIALTGMIAE